MISGFFAWIHRKFFGRDLRAALSETRKIRIRGVNFVIRKVSTLDYLDGSQVMLQYYDEYKLKKDDPKAQLNESTIKKMKEHYRDVFLSAVVRPKLVRKKEDEGAEGIHVDDIFTDMSLANDLYVKIMTFANGKKKI